MSQSNAPGETKKREKNEASLVIQVDFKFNQQVMAQAPEWDRTGIALLRKLLYDDGLADELAQELKQIHQFMGEVSDVNIRVMQ